MSRILVSILILLAINPVVLAQSKNANDDPRGLFVYNENLADEGLTLFAPKAGKAAATNTTESEVYLINMEDVIVHSWPMEGVSSQYAFLLENGDLAYRSNTPAHPYFFDTGASWKRIDWEGTVIWSYENEDLHHDADMVSENEMLFTYFEKLTDDNRRQLVPSTKKPIPDEVWTDYFSVVNVQTGETVWEWHLQDELSIENYPLGQGTEWTHANSIEFIEEGNPFTDGQAILFSVREFGRIFVISYPEGEVLWEWGEDILVGQHDPTLLQNGNVLVFNNGRKQSEVLEVNPATNEVVWSYTDENFYSARTSGAERLSNGNTFITEGDTGRIFEITTDGTIVWEYLNPFDPANDYSIFKAHRYAYDEIDWPDPEIVPSSSSSVAPGFLVRQSLGGGGSLGEDEEWNLFQDKRLWLIGVVVFLLILLIAVYVSRD